MKRIFNLLLGAMLLTLNAQCCPDDPVYAMNAQSSNSDDTGGGLYYPQKPEKPADTKDGYAPEGYSLVWNDEFNDKSSLSREWYFEKGGTGWGNNELQYYCLNGVYTPTGQETARIAGGSLLITAYKVEPSAASDNREYVSTRMNTNKSWKYGYIEMRAKLPAVKGTWPAFWMLSKDGNYDVSKGGGELDIVEWVGNEPDKAWFSSHCQHVTTGSNEQYTDPVTGEKYGHTASIDIEDAGTEFHCFGMEWTHEYIKAFLDGVQYYYAPNPKPGENDIYWWPFDKEYYIKLNLAIGGGWGGEVAPNFTSATYEIDWVRVYQKTE